VPPPYFLSHISTLKQPHSKSNSLISKAYCHPIHLHHVAKVNRQRRRPATRDACIPTVREQPLATSGTNLEHHQRHNQYGLLRSLLWPAAKRSSNWTGTSVTAAPSEASSAARRWLPPLPIRELWSTATATAKQAVATRSWKRSTVRSPPYPPGTERQTRWQQR
jgi:hypothetical protein